MKAEGFRAVLIQAGLEGAVLLLAKMFDELRARMDNQDAPLPPSLKTEDIDVKSLTSTAEDPFAQVHPAVIEKGEI